MMARLHDEDERIACMRDAEGERVVPASRLELSCPRCEGEGLIYSPREHYDLSLEGWLSDWLEDPCPDCLGRGVTTRPLELERAA